MRIFDTLQKRAFCTPERDLVQIVAGDLLLVPDSFIGGYFNDY